MNKIKPLFNSLTRKGFKSPQNEDYLLLPDLKTQELLRLGYFFVLCDGVGGYNAGEIASKICSEWLMTAYYNTNLADDTQFELQRLIKQTNLKIYETAQKDIKLNRMGTTMVSLLIKDEEAFINNVGDSRIYLMSDQKLSQITEDHSPVWELYRNNLISKDDILKDPRKNLITQAMGLKKEVDPYNRIMKLPEKYIFLLCSDGLTDVTKDQEIEEVLLSCLSCQQCLERLYQLSQKHQSIDDVSMIIISNYLDQ